MSQVPGAIVGAGTVLNERQLDEAASAGARFIVSPGLTEPLSRAVERSGVAYLPGVATAGDIMRGIDLGLDRFKFFPAEASGGIAALKALSGPFGESASARRAASVRTMPPNGWRSTPSCALAGHGCTGPATAWKRSRSGRAPPQRCATKFPVNHIAVIYCVAGQWVGG